MLKNKDFVVFNLVIIGFYIEKFRAVLLQKLTSLNSANWVFI